MEQLKILVHTDEDGSLWSEVPDYPGVFASGSNMDELVEATVEALSMVLNDESAPAQDEPVADVLPLAAHREARKHRNVQYSVREVDIDLDLVEA